MNFDGENEVVQLICCINATTDVDVASSKMKDFNKYNVGYSFPA